MAEPGSSEELSQIHEDRENELDDSVSRDCDTVGDPG